MCVVCWGFGVACVGVYALQDRLFNNVDRDAKRQRVSKAGKKSAKKKGKKGKRVKKDAIATAMDRHFDLTKAPAHAEILSFKVRCHQASPGAFSSHCLQRRVSIHAVDDVLTFYRGCAHVSCVVHASGCASRGLCSCIVLRGWLLRNSELACNCWAKCALCAPTS